MYTNIPTKFALTVIRRYIKHNLHKFPDLPFEAVMMGLEIIMKNCYFRFGDTLWKQIKGSSMGMPPTLPYATIFYGCHEERFLRDPQFQPMLLFYKRYIDDVKGIWWIPDPITDPIGNHQK
jgi:hypothetical protein